MFIIDGMPGDYSTLNPNDIESIEVLKDASSTAVYGAAGANGVIIITTKSGKAGKININLNAYVGFNGWARFLRCVVVTVISMYFVKQTKLPEHILRMRHYFLPPKLIRHI